MIAGQRPNGEEVRFTGIEVGLNLGLGKDNAAFAALPQGDPLGSLAVLFQQGQMFGRPGGSLVFQPFFDLLKLIVKDAELLMNREAAFNQWGDLTLFSWPESNTGPFFGISLRRWTPTSADQRRYLPMSAERIILTGLGNPSAGGRFCIVLWPLFRSVRPCPCPL